MQQLPASTSLKMTDFEISNASPLDLHQQNALRVLLKFANVKRQVVDPALLRDSVGRLKTTNTKQSLDQIATDLGVRKPRFRKAASTITVPCLAILDSGELIIVLNWIDDKKWIIGRFGLDGDFTESSYREFSAKTSFADLTFQSEITTRKSHSFKMILSSVGEQKRALLEISLAGIFMMLLAVSISLFSIQVYDRVIPSSAQATLLVLASGAVVAIIFELILKFARSGVVERLTDGVDISLARSIMSRFLGVRLDQLPTSVGSATQVLKGYETVRAYLISLLTLCTVDMPVALFLLFLVYLIGGELAYIPAGFFCLGLLFALYFHRKSVLLSGLAQNAHARKTGILVESIEAAETLKSNNAKWRILSQWIGTTNDARGIDNQLRHVSENAQYILLMFQQISYILLISAGALQVIEGNLTIGSVIGCSILSGRILTPISQIPSLMINWAHAKMSLKSLETYWNLPQEVTGESVSYTEGFNGPIEVRDIETPCFGSGSMPLRIPRLTIKAGERVGLVGSVGSGKSSILRLLAGLTHPDSGYIQIDNLRVETLDRATISREIGYVAQEARLVSGTLRDNLLLGMADPGEQAIVQACTLTGMDEHILATSVKGLDTLINESGNGLSGGQKQLIHITRALLKKPSIFILDEPTASLDSVLEYRILNALREYCAKYPQTIVIAASHRPRILELLDRLIVVHRGEITMDNAKNSVLERLTANTQSIRA